MSNIRLNSFFAAILFGGISLFSSNAQAQSETTMNADASTEASVQGGSSIFSNFSVSGEAKFLVGNSYNVGLLSTKTESTFVKIAPNLSIDWEPSDSLIISISGEAAFKRFGSEIGKSLGNESFFETRAEALYFLSDEWELGGDVAFYSIENQIPSISETGESESIAQKYSEPSGRVYAAWFGESLSIEGAAYAKNRVYRDSFTDQQGNVYKNDYLEYRGEGTLGYRISEDTKAKLQIFVGVQVYKEKMAAFSEGLEPLTSLKHPTLKIFFHEYSLSLNSLLASIATTTKAAMKFNVDQIFGAESHVQYKLQQKFTVPVLSGLSITPQATISLKDYEFFRANPREFASIKPTRRDIEFRAGTDVNYSLTDLISFSARYEFNRLVSNYATLTYSEHQVESGVGMSF